MHNAVKGRNPASIKSCTMKNFTLITAFIFVATSIFAQPKLSSFSPAAPTIYLDFNGEEINSAVWNGGNTLTCVPALLNDQQVEEIFNRVAEDYRPFNINITTDEAVFLAAPVAQRIRVVITPTSSWYPGVGGVAYIGSFNWGDDTPVFVFPNRLGNSPKMVAECCAHESGHSLGLAHQSKYDAGCNLTATYNDGVGSGEVGWAPVMGNSYYRNMSGWNNGPTPYGCGYLQDNLTILTTKNGFTYRNDDFSDDVDEVATAVNPFALSTEGIISTTADKDAFRFTLSQSSTFKLLAAPFSVGANNEGADLDIKLSLYNQSKQLIRVYNPSASMSVSIDTALSAGTYYMLVDGTGNTYASEYGSLGSYALKGTGSILAVRSVKLSGTNENEKHNLEWEIIADEKISSVTVQSSVDGVLFRDIATVGMPSINFSLKPFGQGNMYYRLKVISEKNEAVFSNSIVLKTPERFNRIFTVSTFTRNDIAVNATEQFRYALFDGNGNLLEKGNGIKGFTNIMLANRPNGIYVLQLAAQGSVVAERIVKQ
jgi:hypothetical protein